MRPMSVHAVGLALVAALAGAPARAETTLCTPIAALPTTIAAPGIYCLTSDFDLNMAAGDAILIAANNVVIDLNGHKIGNLAAGPGTFAQGITAEDRQNITIRNGTLRGFMRAIAIEGTAPFTTSQGHLVEDIRADRNTLIGILVRGRGCLIRRNRAMLTGGSTAVSDRAATRAIEAQGPSNRVLDNDVITVVPQASGAAFGILLQESTDALVVDNRITRTSQAIHFNASTGKYRDNLASGGGPYTGGTDAGNNH
jgi:copper-binding protein NosD